jgi:uncharacterized protein
MSPLRWVYFVSAAVASGCASAPSHYYTLVPESGRHTPAAPAAPLRLEVEPVKIPAQVDRLELVTRLPDGSLSIADNERWIAPVADELQSALSIELAQRLGEGEADPSRLRPMTVSVRVEIERFESAPSRYTLVEAAWRIDLRAEGRDVRIACHTLAYEQINSGYPDLVRGYQRGIAHIAREIAGVARQSVADGTAASCPVNLPLGTR